MTNGLDATRLWELLEQRAQRDASATAIEDDAGRSMTYGALNAAAARIANRLHEIGVRRGDRVGVCLPKGLAAVACIQGILKTGAAYVPTDFASPLQRNRYIFDDCQTCAVCIDEARAAALEGGEAELLIFPDQTDRVGAPWMDSCSAEWGGGDGSTEDDLAYILYTSGSTGKPKGVMHTHRSAMSFVRWSAETIQPKPADRFSSHAPFHFDLSILDLYVPFTVGAAIVIIGEDLGKEPMRLAPFIAEKRISVWYSVPSILALLAQYGRLEGHDYSALHTVVFAGEVFPIKHLRALVEKWPGRSYLNLYGPTETNVCTFYRIPAEIKEDRQTPYPIGVPCNNVKALVLEEDHREVSGSDEGVLYIHATGPVMKGYWNQPTMTERSFYTDPSGERWYCTGDVVSTDAQGNYLFVGRRDRMVKRRGYRIELGEIEAALYRHPNVREAAVVSTEDDEGVAITAYLSMKDGQKGSIIAMKQYSMNELPSYMIPDRFAFLDRLPRTSTGKVDYHSLIGAGQTV